MAEDFGSFWLGAQNSAINFGTPNFSDWGSGYEDFFMNPEMTDTSQMPAWDNYAPDWGSGYEDFFMNPEMTSTEQLPNWDAGAPDTNWWDTFSSGAGNLLSGAGKLPWDKILGGAAGIGLAGGLLTNNKGGDSSASSNFTQTQQLPPWWEEGAQQGVAEAGSIPGYESQLDTPGTLLRNTDINQYMNPYLQQTLDPVLRNMDIEQAGEQNQMAANAAKVGAFGGSRSALDQSLALERQGRRRDEAIGTAYRGAYDNAQTGALADIGRTWDDIGTRYEDPYKQTGALSDMLSKTKTDGNISRTGGSTQQAAKANPWMTLAGAATTGASLYRDIFSPQAQKG